MLGTIFATLIFLFACNVRIYLAIFAGVAVYFYLEIQQNPYLPWSTAIQQVITPAMNVNLLAIPFFMLLGALMNHTGISSRLLGLAQLLVGRMIGGLAQANILLSTMMGGLSASNLADSAMLTKMLVPEMEKQGYDRAFAGGVTAAGSLITPIIPPGIALIIYGLVADVSIKQMFLAGFLPGFLCMALLMVAIRRTSIKHGYLPSRQSKPSLGEVGKALFAAIPAFVMIGAIVGGVRAGIFTATEAGGFAVLFSLFIGFFIYREMRLKHVINALSETAQSTASIMIVIMVSTALSWVLQNEQAAQHVTSAILDIAPNKWAFLAAINILLLLMGTIMEGTALMLIIVPLVKPVLAQFGIDPIHFGIIIILNLSIGTLTPPVGTVMLLVCRIGEISVSDFIRKSLPLYVALLVALFIVTYVPVVSLLLPGL